MTLFEKINLFNNKEILFIKEILLKKINLNRTIKIKNIETLHNYINDDDLILKKKINRIFNFDEITLFSKLESFINLLKKFNNYKIGQAVSDNIKIEIPEIYFRLVRPQKECDIGTIHADSWYHDLAQLNYPKGKTYKIWISIISEPNKNGLIFYPNSKNFSTDYIYSNNNFIINEAIKTEKIMPAISPGQAIIFNDTVLHQGSINYGNFTRCSIEITFVPKNL
jgi:hypothetical protein